MRACCCSLAGTRACDNCPNGMTGAVWESKPVSLPGKDDLIKDRDDLKVHIKLIEAIDPESFLGDKTMVYKLFKAESDPELREKIAASLDTDNLITELEKRRPCEKCANIHQDVCECVWNWQAISNEFKPKETR